VNHEQIVCEEWEQTWIRVLGHFLARWNWRQTEISMEDDFADAQQLPQCAGAVGI